VCGRFLTPDESAFERHWGLRAPAGFTRAYNVAPTHAVAVIRLNPQGELQADMLTWSFRPSWAKRGWINARAETAWTNKAFAAAAHERRCLVPAAGWYEWRGDAAPKQPYVLHLGGFRPFSFAGIWTARKLETGWSRSFAILTRDAARPIAEIHDRMPAVLHSSTYAAWLAPETPAEEARQIALQQVAGIQAYPVSTYVNKPGHEGEQCIEPFSAG
jgi:putative SOS response-associated peptidase YedK